MKVCLKTPIIGYRRTPEETSRVHADKGDILPVILNNSTYYICDSKYYPGKEIIVFKNQCAEVLLETEDRDEYAPEKYYHVYEDKSKLNLDDPFYNAFEFNDDVFE